MQNNSRNSRRAAAAFSAFALSLVLFTGTVSVPAKAFAPATAGTGAYMGEIA